MRKLLAAGALGLVCALPMTGCTFFYGYAGVYPTRAELDKYYDNKERTMKEIGTYPVEVAKEKLTEDPEVVAFRKMVADAKEALPPNAASQAAELRAASDSYKADPNNHAAVLGTHLKTLEGHEEAILDLQLLYGVDPASGTGKKSSFQVDFERRAKAILFEEMGWEIDRLTGLRTTLRSEGVASGAAPWTPRPPPPASPTATPATPPGTPATPPGTPATPPGAPATPPGTPATPPGAPATPPGPPAPGPGK